MFLYIFSVNVKLMNALEQNLLSNCTYVCIFYPKKSSIFKRRKSENLLDEIIKRFLMHILSTSNLVVISLKFLLQCLNCIIYFACTLIFYLKNHICSTFGTLYLYK